MDDNNYESTLAAFRSEDSDLCSKIKRKEIPEGLLGFGYMLDEDIILKERRIMVDQEKWRVEMSFQGLQDVIRAYSSSQSAPILPYQDVGHKIHGSFVKHEQPLLPPPKVSTSIANCSSGEKRKASRPASTVLPPPKKYHAGSSKDLHMLEDVM